MGLGGTFITQLLLILMTSLLSLPKRSTGSYLKACKKEIIKTNLYKVDFSDKAEIIIHSLSIEPSLPYTSSKINVIVDLVKPQLQQLIGNYIICGKNIFSCQTKIRSKQAQVRLEASLGSNEKYVIVLKPVRKIDLSALSSSKTADTLLPLNFLNNLIKKFFNSMKFVSIGRTGKYFNPKAPKTLSNSGIILFNGYETCFNIAQNGLYLQVHSIVRIIQNKTVLDEINSIYGQCPYLSKDEKRNTVKAELIGKTVMANYGNSKIWVIKDVLFDFDYETRKVGEQFDMNFLEYYQKTYGIIIKIKRQPALKAVMSGMKKSKITQESILIPELMLMSGLPNDFDERRRREISEFTILQPEEKLQKIQNFIHSLNRDPQNFCPNLISQNLGIKISPIAQSVEAISLPPPVIQLGQGQSIEKGKVASFQLFNKQIYYHEVPINVVVIIPNDYDFTGIDKLFSTTCKNLYLRHKLNVFKINFHDVMKAMQEIERYIADKDKKFDDYDLNWFILPPSMKTYYKTIKQLSLKAQNPKVTQVTLTTTFAKKGFASILTKILLQISSKVGNVPWAPKVPSAVNPKTLLLGVDVCKDTTNKNFNIVAYCATINKEMTKFHSNYHYQPYAMNFCLKMNAIIAECLTVYVKENSYLPQEIIILKSDLSDGEKDFIVNTEVSQVKDALKEMSGYTPKLTFVTVNKNSKQKFFSQGRTTTNPGCGTLINSKIVSKNYDFYLISQYCNRGTVKPIHYKVLYTDSKMEEGVLQELIYCQSFNYMNWSGSIRVPSVLQYAIKLASFVSEYISKEPETQQLNELLYYI